MRRMLEVSTSVGEDKGDNDEVQMLRQKLTAETQRSKKLEVERGALEQQLKDLARQREAQNLLMRRAHYEGAQQLKETQEKLEHERSEAKALRGEILALPEQHSVQQQHHQDRQLQLPAHLQQRSAAPDAQNASAVRIMQQEQEIRLGRTLLKDAENAIKELEQENHELTIKLERVLDALSSAEDALHHARGDRNGVTVADERQRDLVAQGEQGASEGDTQSPLVNSIRSELLLATASKETLLRSMCDLHDAMSANLVPAVCTLHLHVDAFDRLQNIKYALHRDICESLGLESFGALHVAYVMADAPASEHEQQRDSVTEVTAGITFLPFSEQAGSDKADWKTNSGGVLRRAPYAMAHELLRQFNASDSMLMAEERITANIFAVDVMFAVAPEQLAAIRQDGEAGLAAGHDAAAASRMEDKHRELILAAADDWAESARIKAGLGGQLQKYVSQLVDCLGELEDRYQQDEDCRLAFSIAVAINSDLEHVQATLDEQQGRIDVLEDLLAKAEEFLRTAEVEEPSSVPTAETKGPRRTTSSKLSDDGPEGGEGQEWDSLLTTWQTDGGN